MIVLVELNSLENKRNELSDNHSLAFADCDQLRSRLFKALTVTQLGRLDQDFSIENIKRVSKSKDVLRLATQYNNQVEAVRTLSKELDLILDLLYKLNEAA